MDKNTKPSSLEEVTPDINEYLEASQKYQMAERMRANINAGTIKLPKWVKIDMTSGQASIKEGYEQELGTLYIPFTVDDITQNLFRRS